jgi:hypothetical protein
MANKLNIFIPTKSLLGKQQQHQQKIKIHKIDLYETSKKNFILFKLWHIIIYLPKKKIKKNKWASGQITCILETKYKCWVYI